MADRIQAIESMLEKTPNDVFLQYSLGMEYAAAERHKEAVKAFKRCIDLDEGYLPAYVEAGKCLRSGGDLDAAREMFARGMELATAKGESHVRDFIRQQLEALPRKE
jgi:tetratricopeptide (TPR) repeat protein